MADNKSKFFKGSGYNYYTNNKEMYFTQIFNNTFEVIDEILLSPEEQDYRVTIMSELKDGPKNVGGTKKQTILTSDQQTKVYDSYIIKFVDDNNNPTPTIMLPDPFDAKTKEEFINLRSFYPRGLIETSILDFFKTSPTIGFSAVAYKKEGVWFLREISEVTDDKYKNFIDNLGESDSAQDAHGQGSNPGKSGARGVYPNSGQGGVGKKSSKSNNKKEPQGWNHKKGTVLNDSVVSFVDDVKKNAPNLEIFINSAFRDNTAQARAIVAKMKLGDKLSTVYAQSTYKKFVELTGYVDGVASANFGDKEIKAIADWYDSKKPSSHLTGNAVDFRTKHLNDSQLNELQNAVRKTGETPEFETTPQHVHVTITQSKYKSQNAGVPTE
jgi:hypothetical protein